MNKRHVVISTLLISLLGIPASYAEEKAAEEKDAPIMVGGFVDGMFKLTDPAVIEKGFILNDGAVYLSKEFGGAEVKVDLPFKGGAEDNTFAFATEKAQAYAAYKHSNGLRWKLGQFDALFGFEANDSADRKFAESGIMGDLMMPSTILGALVGYDFSEAIGLNVYVANPSDAGILGRQNPEFGAQVTFAQGDYRGSVGASLLQDKELTEKKTNMLLNALAGATFGALETDVEFNYWQTAGSDTKALGLGGYFTYAITEALEGSLRLQYLNNVLPGEKEATLTDGATMLQGTIGPEYKLTKGLSARVDYSLTMSKASADADYAKSHAGILSVVARF